jgi:hypothetical protein
MSWRPIVLVGAATAIGVIAWSGPFPAIALALVVPGLWAAAESRWQAGAAVAAYQLAATRSLPTGIEAYYGTLLARGVVLWGVAALLVAGVWIALWRPKTAKWRLLGAAGALFLTAFPPIGVVGWVSPLTAAGALFPNCGWLGLLGTVLVIEALVSARPKWLAAGAVFVVLWAAILAGPVKEMAGWRGIDTAGGRTDAGNAMGKMIELPRLMRSSPARVALYPETVAGLWMPGEEAWWKKELGSQGRVALVGAEVVESDGRYANAVIEISPIAWSVVYRQRMPVPLTMWRPWAADTAHAYWFRNPVVLAAGKRAAVLICYEQALVWPVLCSMADSPEVVVATSNDWWCRDSAIPTIQRNSVRAWCRLFGLPAVMAFNR